MSKVNVTRDLAEFAVNLTYDQLPEEVVEQVKKFILDGATCGVYGSTMPSSRRVQELVAEKQGLPESTVWGTAIRAWVGDAALANGTSVNSFETDDVHKDALVHAESVSVAPALALAEKLKGVTGKRFITAIAAGCEVAARIGLVVGFPQLTKGYHPAATTGTFVAAVTAGYLMKLPLDQMVHCMGIGGTQAAGLISAQRGAMAKAFHMGRAAQAGIYGALLAQKGFTGAQDIVEAEYGGFCGVMADIKDIDTDKIFRGLGKQWECLNIGFKDWACGLSTYCSVEAILEITKKHPEIKVEDIKEILVKTTTITQEHAGWKFDPKESPGSARLNIGYNIARAFISRTIRAEHWHYEAISEPAILPISNKVRVIIDPALDSLGADKRHAIRMTVFLNNGKSYEYGLDYARGSFHRPLTKEDLTAKFNDLVGRVFSPEQKQKLYNAIETIEEMDDVSKLAEFLKKA